MLLVSLIHCYFIYVITTVIDVSIIITAIIYLTIMMIMNSIFAIIVSVCIFNVILTIYTCVRALLVLIVLSVTIIERAFLLKLCML